MGALKILNIFLFIYIFLSVIKYILSYIYTKKVNKLALSLKSELNYYIDNNLPIDNSKKIELDKKISDLITNTYKSIKL